MRIRTLALYLGVGILSLAGAGVFYNRLEESVTEKFHKSQIEVCGMVGTEIKEEFNFVSNLLTNLAYSPQAENVLEQKVNDLIAADKRYKESAKERLPEGEWNNRLIEHFNLQEEPLVDGFYFINPKGVCLARMPWREGRVGRDFTDRPAIDQIVNRQYQGLIVTEKVDAVREKTPSLALSYGLVEDGKLKIITRAIIHMDDFSDRFLKGFPAYDFSIINSAGIVVADTTPGHINKDADSVDQIKSETAITMPLEYRDIALTVKLLPDMSELDKTLSRVQLEAYLLFGALAATSMAGIELYKSRKRLKAELQERKRAEDELRLHGTVMANMDEGVYLIRMDNGIIVYTNPKFEKMFGYNPDEMIGKHVSIVNDPTDKHSEETAKEIMGILERTGEWHGEIKNTKKDGALFWCFANVSIFNHPKYGKVLISIHTDITKHKQAEETIQQQHALLKSTIESLTYPFYVIDVNDYTIKLANSATGSDIPENATCYALTHKRNAPCADAKHRCPVEEIKRTGKPVTLEHIHYDDKGNVVNVEVHAYPIFDEQGEVKQIIEYALDITERVNAEEALAEYRDQLRSLSSQLSLVEEHERERIAGLLHDDVCQMLGLIAMKLRPLEALDLQPEVMESVSESCEMLKQAIESTRTLLSDLRPALLYDLGLEMAVDKLVEHMIEWQEDIKPGFEDDGQPKPLGNNVRMLLYQSIRELLMNIVKHAQASKVKVSMRKEENNISIIVEDDGVGFDVSEVIERAGRTGHFGLFSIRERMRNLNGKIEIESEANSGTRITLLAPLSN